MILSQKTSTATTTKNTQTDGQTDGQTNRKIFHLFSWRRVAVAASCITAHKQFEICNQWRAVYYDVTPMHDSCGWVRVLSTAQFRVRTNKNFRQKPTEKKNTHKTDKVWATESTSSRDALMRQTPQFHCHPAPNLCKFQYYVTIVLSTLSFGLCGSKTWMLEPFKVHHW